MRKKSSYSVNEFFLSSSLELNLQPPPLCYSCCLSSLATKHKHLMFWRKGFKYKLNFKDKKHAFITFLILYIYIHIY